MNELIEQAKKATLNSYVPYSNFKVGAALLCKNGKVYLGCNIENKAFGPSICAERVAFSKAISEGEKEFTAIAIIGGDDICPPCGICRQVMSEFCNDDFIIYLEGKGNKIEKYTLNELLPHRF